MHTEYVIKRIERGWASHFICADRCLFRRSTTVEYNGQMVLISTVGRMMSHNQNGFERIGCDRYYETMCWLADPNDKWHDASTALKEIHIDSNSALDEVDDEWGANNMHEAIVEEMTTKLINNSLEYYEDKSF